jgi:hypothetical protein
MMLAGNKPDRQTIPPVPSQPNRASATTAAPYASISPTILSVVGLPSNSSAMLGGRALPWLQNSITRKPCRMTREPITNTGSRIRRLEVENSLNDKMARIASRARKMAPLTENGYAKKRGICDQNGGKSLPAPR